MKPASIQTTARIGVKQPQVPSQIEALAAAVGLLIAQVSLRRDSHAATVLIDLLLAFPDLLSPDVRDSLKDAAQRVIES